MVWEKGQVLAVGTRRLAPKSRKKLRGWTRTEAVLNFSVAIAPAIAGLSHGFAEFAFPFLFSLLFYFAFFWVFLISFRRIATRLC